MPIISRRLKEKGKHTAELFAILRNHILGLFRQWAVNVRRGHYGRATETKALKQKYVYYELMLQEPIPTVHVSRTNSCQKSRRRRWTFS